jgi:hypothetical protein
MERAEGTEPATFECPKGHRLTVRITGRPPGGGWHTTTIFIDARLD